MRNLSNRDEWKIIKDAYRELKPHESYWMMDNDYRRKYEYVKEAATENQSYTRDTVTYITDRALFLLDACKRIFGK